MVTCKKIFNGITFRAEVQSSIVRGKKELFLLRAARYMRLWTIKLKIYTEIYDLVTVYTPADIIYQFFLLYICLSVWWCGARVPMGF